MNKVPVGMLLSASLFFAACGGASFECSKTLDDVTWSYSLIDGAIDCSIEDPDEVVTGNDDTPNETNSCSVMLDADDESLGFWQFSQETDGTKSAVYTDIGSDFHGTTVEFAVEDCN